MDVIYEDIELLDENAALEMVENHDEDIIINVEDASNENEDVVFVECLKKYGRILLQKTQTPAAKIKKKEAVQHMIEHLLERGFQYTEMRTKKKIENMKSRLKIKIDKKKTGNLPIVLKPAEKLLMQILDGTDNPSISRLQFGKTVGVDDQNSTTFNVETSLSTSQFLSPCASNHSKQSFEKPSSKKNLFSAVKKREEETYSNKVEMQKKIFDEQMEVFRIQKELYTVQTEYYRKKLQFLDDK